MIIKVHDIFVQYSEMKMLNPTSVNKVRILTFWNEMIVSALRFGTTVYNLHSNGIRGHIDMKFIKQIIKKVKNIWD